MRRKIIKQGTGGCTIFLPIKWVRKNKLSAGDEVDITEMGNSLVVTGESSSTRRVTIHLTNNATKRYVRSLFASAYKAGYEEIEVRFDCASLLTLIDQVVMSFTGLEIVNSQQDKILIRSFLNSDTKELDNLMVKLFQINREMLRVITDESDSFDAQTCLHLKNNGKRLRDHCLRIIHAQKYGNDLSYDYYDLVTQLEKSVADSYLFALDIANKGRKKPKLAPVLRKHFDCIYNCFLHQSPEEAESLYTEIAHSAHDEIHRKLSKVNSEMVHYYHIMQRYLHIASRMLSISVMNNSN